MTAPTVAEVLRRAAFEIDTRGWCQGTLMDIAGCVCGMGAIHCAATGSPYGSDDWEDDDVATAAVLALETHLGRAVYDWNDDPDRTADEVKAALLAAAGKAAES